MERLALLLVVIFAATPAHGFYNGEIDINGQIVDEAGNPLTDIRLEIAFSQFTLFSSSFSKRKVTNKDLASGEFSWRCRRCSSVQLHFSRKGYHSESLRYSVEKDPEPTDPSDRNPPFTGDLKITDIRVVLRSAENVVKLKRHRGRLYSSGSGALRALSLDEERIVDMQSGEAADPEAQFLRLLPVADEAGVLTDLPAPPTVGVVLRHPAAPSLVLHGAGGFVPFQSSINKAEAYLQMRQAPATGYVSSLKIDKPLGENLFFYVRSGDRFGKGFVTGASYSRDLEEESVTVFVEVRFNESGSRNVETTR